MTVRERVKVDPSITEAAVMGGEVVRRGSRVKHFGQRYTGNATAAVVGFARPGPDLGYRTDWTLILVEPDDPESCWWGGEIDVRTRVWDWDRTEAAPDVLFPETEHALDALRREYPGATLVYHRLRTEGRGWRVQGQVETPAGETIAFTTYPEGHTVQKALTRRS